MNLSAALAKIMGKMQPTMIQLEGASGVAYNSEATIKLQAGLVYHSFELETNLKTISTIEKITLDIGGIPVAYATGTMLDMLDKAYQKHQDEGRFVFDMSKFEYRTSQGIFQTQLTTTLLDSVTLKITFKNKSAEDPAVPTLKGKAYVTNTTPLGRIYLPVRKELTQQSASAGEHVWNYPDGSPRSFLQRMVFVENEVSISEIKVKRGERVIHRLTRKDLDFALQRHAGVALQAGYCILDFTQFGFGSEGALSTEGLKFELTVDGAGAIKTYVEGFNQVKELPTAAQLAQLVQAKASNDAYAAIAA